MDGNRSYEDGFSSLVTHLDLNVFGANEMWRPVYSSMVASSFRLLRNIKIYSPGLHSCEIWLSSHQIGGGGGVTTFTTPSNIHPFNPACSFTLGLPTFTNRFHNSPNLHRDWMYVNRNAERRQSSIFNIQRHHIKFQLHEAFLFGVAVISVFQL